MHATPEAENSPASERAPVQFRTPPEQFVAVKRDPREALRFLRDFQQDGRKMQGRRPSEATSELAQEVQAHAWYHTIELPGGVVTPGMFDHRPVVEHYGIPDDLSGKRCLDIACSDGFWAFEFERRGGEVTATNVGSADMYDLPTGAARPPALLEQPLDCFSIAHRALGSKVRWLERSIYDLDPSDLGMFDLVHAGDVLLHLERPLEALRRFHSMTAAGGMALIADSIDPSLEGNVTRYAGGFEGLLWWLPSLECLVQMVYDAGFAAVDVLTLYNVPSWDHPAGYWRAVLRATP